MLPELGHFALILAWLLALLLGVFGLAGAQRGQTSWMALAPRLAAGQALFVALAFGCLVAAFVGNDFSVRNVAENSNSSLPALYRVTAAWGSHEGSMLLWVLMQSLWLLAVVLLDRPPAAEVRARVLGVMGLLAAGLLAFVLFVSNPFVRVFPIPEQGRDLNPLLQDPGMVLHPPLLYMGYVGFSVAFAFALAALLGGDSRAWARRARPWTAVAWVFLTLGVMVGSGWAYYELGWGGWWFWDPVENAALMPWLLGTALLHALAVTDRRGSFGAWSMLLAIVCFGLSLLGTFLVRSGVLSSVHAFAIDPRRGLFILGLLVAVVGGSLALYAWRAPRPAAAPVPVPVPLARETLLLANTLLLAVAAATVLLGTFYPLLHELLGLGRLSVGPPYFEAVFVPLMVPVLFLMAVGPLAQYGGTTLPELWRRLRWALAAALLAGLGLTLVGGGSALRALGLFLACWVVLGAAADALRRMRGTASSPRPGLARQPRAWWGMLLAHLGVALFVAGVTLVRSHQSETEVRMAPGERVVIGGHELVFEGVHEVEGPNYVAQRGRFELWQDGRARRSLEPEKRRYASMPASPLTEAAIASNWLGDVYVSLGDDFGQGAWSVRAYHKPFVTWIWGGCALMALGGLLAALDPRYRQRRRARTTADAFRAA